MKSFPGNPHADQAIHYSAEASLLNEWPTAERGILAMQGQTHATLALVHEQRTANLIALAEAASGAYPFGEVRERAIDVALERLGLIKS